MMAKIKEWVIKLFWRYVNKPDVIMIPSWRGPNWYFIDGHNRMWRVRYTGDERVPLEYELFIDRL